MITLQQKVRLAVCNEKAKVLCQLLEDNRGLHYKAYELSCLLHELKEELVPTPTPEFCMRLNELREIHDARAEEGATETPHS